MENKTCGECKHFMDGICIYGDDPFEVEKDSPYCDDRFFESAPKPTNGDVIRQMSDGVLAFTVARLLLEGCPISKSKNIYDCEVSNDCVSCLKQWFNAPAEINLGNKIPKSVIGCRVEETKENKQ